MTNYNWSSELQIWVDILNTPISQAPPTPDEFGDASPLRRRSSAAIQESYWCRIQTFPLVESY
jgi:hypothetical protein